MADTDWRRELSCIEEVDPETGRNWRNLLDDASALADAVDRYWVDEVLIGGGVRVGLSRSLPRETASELREMSDELSRAVNDHCLAVDLEDGELGPCAEFVFSELTSALAFLAFQDDDSGASTLRELVARFEEPQTDAARAAQLRECARLAQPERARLRQLADFDATLIDDAIDLAQALLARDHGGNRSTEARRTLARRDRLATLLARRLAHVRRTAWFVFRHHRQVQRSFPGPSARPTPASFGPPAAGQPQRLRSADGGQRRRSG
jgi:hypothetical protein